MEAVIKCPACGHKAEDHKYMTTKRDAQYKPKYHTKVPNRPEGVCALSKSFLKRTLVARK